MASEADIQALLNEGQSVLDTIRAFSDQPVPDNLAQAAERGIDLALQAGEAAILVHYPEAERAEDRKRVIRLDHALQLLSDFEEEYLKATVQGSLRVALGFLWASTGGIFVDVWAAILAVWTAIRTLREEAVRAALARVWVLILRHLFEVAAVAEVAGPLKDVLSMRRKYDGQMRAKALKQRTVKRVWRRKRTRG